jgi:hypothetical protein
MKKYAFIIPAIILLFTSCITAIEKDKTIEYPFAHHVFSGFTILMIPLIVSSLNRQSGIYLKYLK